MLHLITQPYLEQVQRWPQAGRHILAQFDDRSIVVYQAYRQSVGQWAVAHQRFGGPDFSFGRMSWVKPNFSWMMCRSGWGTSTGQEVVLAVHLRREALDAILRAAVPSSFEPGSNFATRDGWQHAAAQSSVRLQWDPDHDPSGAKLERRAIQLGLRGPTLERYANEWIVEIEDLAEFVCRSAPVCAGRSLRTSSRAARGGAADPRPRIGGSRRNCPMTTRTQPLPTKISPLLSQCRCGRSRSS
jgi:hypothetical protein